MFGFVTYMNMCSVYMYMYIDCWLVYTTNTTKVIMLQYHSDFSNYSEAKRSLEIQQKLYSTNLTFPDSTPFTLSTLLTLFFFLRQTRSLQPCLTPTPVTTLKVIHTAPSGDTKGFKQLPRPTEFPFNLRVSEWAGPPDNDE